MSNLDEIRKLRNALIKIKKSQLNQLKLNKVKWQ